MLGRVIVDISETDFLKNYSSYYKHFSKLSKWYYIFRQKFYYSCFLCQFI